MAIKVSDKVPTKSIPRHDPTHDYTLSEEFLKKYKGKQPNWGYNGLGYIAYKRTYARRLEEENRTEEWWETIARCTNWLMGLHKQMHIDLGMEVYQKIFDAVFNLKCSFSGRMLWQAGTETVERIGGSSLNNCWGVIVDHPDAFTFTFDQLMLGGGVGYNIQREYVFRLPKIKKGIDVERKDTNDADFILPDSREGWVELLRKVLWAFFYTGKSFTYSTVLVRSKGAPIRGFGGYASGPDDLCRGIEKIKKVIKKREGKTLRPLDCLDIMNIIGQIVVAGNVRRSAQIALADVDDIIYLLSKSWSEGNIPNWRAMSNNSVVCNDISHLPDVFWKGYQIDPNTSVAYGEPFGLFNKKLVQNKGRLVDDHRTDPGAVVTNPCAEISLAPRENTGNGEPCNLGEIFLNNIEDVDDFKEVAELVYYVVKTITLLDYHWEVTNDIVHTNHRLGIGITGVVDRPDLINPDVLSEVYQHLELLDYSFSEQLNIKESIKLTTVKPSGTLSLLAGCSPGVHPAYSRFYIRRIRMASSDPLVKICRESGYKVDYAVAFDGTIDRTTVVVEFPVEAPDEAIIKADMTAIKQLDLVKHIQTYWSDNQVSCTVYYKPEELPEIKSWLKENYKTGIKAISFLLHSEHGFAQAPYEEISKDLYNELKENVSPVFIDKDVGLNGDDDDTINDFSECGERGHCPVK